MEGWWTRESARTGFDGGSATIRIADDIRLITRFLTTGEADELASHLGPMADWHQDSITIYGKTHPLPRLHRWFTESNELYRWSGIDMRPEPFPTALRNILRRIQGECGVTFNAALGNLYRCGKDSVGWHSDDEPDLGQDPVIVSLSLGATRRFSMRLKSDRAAVKSFDLEHGSLLVMAGKTQALWEHNVPKTTQAVGPRVNLTFRVIHKTGAWA